MTFVWSYGLLRQLGLKTVLALICALLIQADTTVLVSYWWYNPITTVAAALYLLSATLFLRRSAAFYVQCSYLLSLLLLAILKPNTAGLLLVGGALVLLSSKSHRWQTMIISGAGFTVFIFWLTAQSIQLGDVLNSYLGIAARGFSLDQFLQDLSTSEKVLSLSACGLILLPILLSHRGWRALSGGDREQWLAIIAAGAGFYAFVTNGESKLVDLPLLFLSALLFTLPREKVAQKSGAMEDRFGSTFLARIALPLIMLGVGEGLTRHRVELIGPGTFFQNELVAKPISAGFFKGMKAGPVFVKTYMEEADLIAHSRGKKIFFGPRMQFGYAAFQQPSPVGQPIWWHPGVSFPMDDEPRYLADWSKQHFDELIFLRGDFTYYPAPFLQKIQTAYTLDNHYPLLMVFHWIADHDPPR